jgi:glycosyltransferase involved in cell wall biosynthesis
MHERIPALTESLVGLLGSEDNRVELIISHYWDGADLGVRYNRLRLEHIKHIWVPHSLGAVKKRNVPETRWERLRIDERIAVENGLVSDLDHVVATSSRIRRSLLDDYGCKQEPLFLPPCVDTERYHPRDVSEEASIWSFLGQLSGMSPEEVRRCKIVTEISRTDTSKRKDVLIRAFAQARERVPESLLVVSVDESEEELASDLKRLVCALQLQRNVAAVGYVWDLLPTLYAVSDVYCTPSVMEGFGMSVQEAAATGVPVVASDLVPFATEFLLGAQIAEAELEGSDHPLKLGEGAIVAHADDVNGFARALEMLLSDGDLREEMGRRAYQITVPYFTWPRRVSRFLQEVNIEPRDADICRCRDR